MRVKQKKSKVDKGKNVRLSSDGFKKIKSFVDQHNYKLGGFVESAVLEKIEKEMKHEASA